MAFNVVFFGTPKFSGRFLEKLIHDETLPITISCVVTRKDKPVGRDQELEQSAVKKIALANKIKVVDNITAEDMRAMDIDLGLVYAYGKILSEDILHATKHGFWNIHPSLLPKYRGASPTAYALIMGDEATGCTLMKMDPLMDHGPIIAQDRLTIMKEETHESLLEKLTYVGYYLFRTKVQKLIEGTFDDLELAVQNDSMATFTRLLKREDGFVEYNLIMKALNKEKIKTEEFPQIMRDFLGQNSTSEFPIPYAPYIVFNLFRGLNPWPGIWTKVTIEGQQQRLKIIDLTLESGELIIKEVQLEGKTPVQFEQFRASYRLFN